jgi:heme/copper-type cytochrome/quinol oxidase subunit 2
MEGSMSRRKIFPQLEPRKVVKLWLRGAVFAAALFLLYFLAALLGPRDRTVSPPTPNVFDYLAFLVLLLTLVWFLVAPAMPYLAWKITAASRPLPESEYPAVRSAEKRQLVVLWTVTIVIMLMWLFGVFSGWLLLILGVLGIVDIPIG